MHRRLSVSALAGAIAITLSPALDAQVIFGKQVANGVTGIFEDDQGTVRQIATGLPAGEFPSLAPNARTITFASNDPAQIDSLSNDLFALNRATGQSVKLFDNVTTTLPQGGTGFATPLFSGTSADGGFVAFANQMSTSSNQGGGSVRVLDVVDGHGGGLASTAEIGQGNSIDFFESEFLGISWAPSTAAFLAPGYVPVTSNTGRQTTAAGLVLFGPDGSGQFGRLGTFTTPRVTDTNDSIIIETHAFPAFSPDGQHVAFFRITYPDPLLLQPVTADLIVVDLNAQGAILATFNPGYYPLGVAWSADGGTLVFSAGQQTFGGGHYAPSADPNTAALYSMPSTGGNVGGVAGAPVGYFPSVVAVPPQIFANGFDR